MADGTAREILDLKNKLAQALIERDDLARDVESLCMETTANTTFSSSSVLRERIFSTEKELSRAKTDLLTVTAERDSIREDLREIKEAKRIADQSFRDQETRLEALQREVTFYRQQAAQAISQRDNTVWECEQLRQRTVEADLLAREAAGKAESAETERTVAERRADEAEKKAEELQTAANAAKEIPQLKKNLETGKNREIELLDQIEKLKIELEEAKEGLQVAVSRAETEEQEHQTAVATATSTLEETQAQVAAAKEQLNEVTCQKIDALVRLSEAQTARSKADAEIIRLTAALEASLEITGQATQQKVAALMQVAALRAEVEGSAQGVRSPIRRTPQASPSKTPPPAAGSLISPEKWRGLFGGGGSNGNGGDSTTSSPVKSPL
jgi:chromosome segregation ATPase